MNTNHTTTNTSTSPAPSATRRWTKRLLPIVAAIAVASTVTGSADAGPVEDEIQACLEGASGTPDSLERAAQRCEAGAQGYRDAYEDCLRNAPGTADSLERWVDTCAQQATDAVG